MAASIATEINIHFFEHLFTLLCTMVSPWTSPFVVQVHDDRVCALCAWLGLCNPTAMLEDSMTSVKTFYIHQSWHQTVEIELLYSARIRSWMKRTYPRVVYRAQGSLPRLHRLEVNIHTGRFPILDLWKGVSQQPENSNNKTDWWIFTVITRYETRIWHLFKLSFNIFFFISCSPKIYKNLTSKK